MTVVSGAFDTLGSTVNAALSWPSTRPEQASVIANATNRILVLLLFIYSFPLFSAHSVKLTVRILSDGVDYNGFSHLLQVALRSFLRFLFGIHGPRLSDVVHGPLRKLNRVCVNKRHAQLSYWILRGKVRAVFRIPA